MTEQELIQSINSIAESMANTFSSYSHDVLQAFSEERKEARAMLRDITVSSEQRLDRANVFVTQFAHSAEELSKMATIISTEYAEHIKKLTDERDRLLKEQERLLTMVEDQQNYIRQLQSKVDDRDDHIKSLLIQNAQQANAVTQLMQRLTGGPLVQNDFGVHH